MARARNKHKRHKAKKTTAPASATQDITIHDYANATKPAGRVKKHNTIMLSGEDIPAHLHLELASSSDNADHVEQDAAAEVERQEGARRCRQGRRRGRREGEELPSTGSMYPEILFYLLSRYILPEDVGRFSGINRTTYAITKREGFWRGLYSRHCMAKSAMLPARLHLGHAPRLYGLRQRVVCALYHLYPPFLHKWTDSVGGSGGGVSLSTLVGRRCVDMWYVKSADSWLYYVKLKRMGMDEQGREDDIDANPERNSCVLLVKCAELEQSPPAMGLLLSSVTSSLAAGGGFRLRRLQLGFTRSLHLPPVAAATPPDLTCILNTVQETSVVRWWERQYPPFVCAPPPPASDDEPFLHTDFLHLAV